MSTATPGLMVNVDPNTDGLISLPLFIATSPTQGWIRHSRGVIVAGGVPGSGGGGGGENPNVVAVHQPLHNLQVGQFVRLQGPVDYVLADSTSKQNSQVVGLVINVVTVNDFVLQTSGYNIGAVTQDDLGAALVPGTTYYLSATLSGAIGAEPTAAGLFSKPLFVSEQAGGTNAGYIYEQRPLAAAVGNAGASPLIFCGVLNDANSYSSQTILQDADGNLYNSYQVVIHSGDEVGNYGIKYTGAPLIGIGFQFFIDGIWQTVSGNYADYISGVNSTAGVDTATWWGHVANTAGLGREMGLVLPPVSNHMGLISGNSILTCAPSGHVMVGNYVGVDLSGITPIGYSSSGWMACDAGVGQATGIRVSATAPAVLTPGSSTYITFWGIPNS